jgi:hypothetical protein
MFKLLEFRTQCKANKKCDNCEEDHDKSICKGLTPKCRHCKSQHKASDPSCLERKRRNNINIIMATKNLSYLETIEQFPIYTSNSYNLLENLEEFPTLTAANYARTLKSSNKRKSFTWRNNSSSNDAQPKKVREAIDVNKWNRYYEEMAIKENNSGPIVDNPYKTSELERFKNTIKINENKNENSNITSNINTNFILSSPLNTLENMDFTEEAIVNDLFRDSNLI